MVMLKVTTEVISVQDLGIPYVVHSYMLDDVTDSPKAKEREQ